MAVSEKQEHEPRKNTRAPVRRADHTDRLLLIFSSC